MERENPFLAPLIEYLGLVTINRWWESEEHIRPVWKLYWNSKIGAKLNFNNKNIDLKPEKIYLIAPMTQYTPYCRSEVEHFYIHFSLPREYSSMSQGIWEIDPRHFRYSEIRDISKDILNSYSRRLLFMEIINFSLRQLPSSFFEQRHHNPLGEIFLWLDKNLHKNCDNKVLAEFSGFSEDTLNRYFLKETGITPQKYVRNLRISRGANLLKLTENSVEQIAELCGFYDRPHFHRLFKKGTGFTPVEFRYMSQNSIIHRV
ncbi:MAG: AraC family transcriptional regulator [Spirochaetaceae bacterium]